MKQKRLAHCWQGVAIRNTVRGAIAASTLLFSTPAVAQIVPDATLPVNSIVTPNGNTLTINGGSRAGSNLFHSFQEFSLPTGSEAFFNNAVDVQNIFSRVTGSNISNIDGLIRANGAANLFLLNPNGIVFGPNARLNIGGSFIGTTANSIRFADGMEFSATNPATSPLLTVSVPIGLQMGTNPGEIQVNGSGHSLRGQFFRPTTLNPSSSELRVQPGKILALVGTNLTLNGGTLSANGGNLSLFSVGSNSLVNLISNAQDFSLDDSNVRQFEDIRFVNRSLVNVSGTPAGSIQVRGRRVSIQDGSILLGQAIGSGTSGSLDIRASDQLNIDGLIPDINLSSGIRSEATGVATGAKINVSASQIAVTGAGQITSTSYDRAIGGSIDVQSGESAQVSGVFTRSNGSFVNSLIAVIAFQESQAGNVSLSSPVLSIFDRGVISTTAFGLEAGGEVYISADRIMLDTGGILGASTYSSGNAGKTTIDTTTLVLQTGGIVSTSTYSSGAAGSITIDATDSIELSGVTPSGPVAGRPTQISSAAVNASPAIQRLLGFTQPVSGESGRVTIETSRLRVTERATISASNEGSGIGGAVEIDADSITLDRGGKLATSTTSGEGGNITLQSENLQLRNNSAITTSAGGTGNGGNITIDSPTLVGLENSDIIANAVQGRGGNIQINTQGIFGLENRPQLTPGSDITASSQFGLSGNVTITNPEVETRSFLVELPQNLVDTSQQITTGCDPTQGNTFTIAGRGGLPEDPTSGLLGRAIWFDDRDLSADGSTASLPARSLPKSQPSPEIVEANGWIVNEKGQVELVAHHSNRANSWQAPANCPPHQSSSLR